MDEGLEIRMSSYYTINAPSVLGETVDDEAIIVDLDSGAYFSLRGAGASVWNALERRPGEDELIRHMRRSHDGDGDHIEKETRRLLDELVAEGLIRRVEGRPPTSDASVDVDGGQEGRPAFTAPVLEKYTDMADLLLLDPIHEVDQAEGWPMPRSG